MNTVPYHAAPGQVFSAQNATGHKPTAFWAGMADAKEEAGCVPEMYFVRRSQIREYCKGYEYIAGPCLMTVYFLRPEEMPLWL